MSTATQHNHRVMPGEIRALASALSNSGSVPAIVRRPQHGCGRFTLVDSRYFVILKTRQALVRIAGLILGESQSDNELDHDRGFARPGSEHALILPSLGVGASWRSGRLGGDAVLCRNLVRRPGATKRERHTHAATARMYEPVPGVGYISCNCRDIPGVAFDRG